MTNKVCRYGGGKVDREGGGLMAVQDHIERCAIEELLRLKPHLNISKLGDELLSRTPRIDWF